MAYGDGPQLFCFRCSFAAGAETGAVGWVTVTVRLGDRAQVLPGDVRDAFGERNGARSELVLH